MLPTVSFKKVVQQQSAPWGRSQAFFLDETSTISCYCTQELHGLNFHVPIIDFLQLSRLIIYTVFYYWDVKSLKQKRTKKCILNLLEKKNMYSFPHWYSLLSNYYYFLPTCPRKGSPTVKLNQNVLQSSSTKLKYYFSSSLPKEVSKIKIEKFTFHSYRL